MLTGVGQQTPGTPGQTGNSTDDLAGRDESDGNDWDGGDAIDMPTCSPGEPPSPVCPQRPLRRLTSIRDGTAHGGSDSLVDPTMALGPISRQSAAFQLAQDGQTCRLTV